MSVHEGFRRWLVGGVVLFACASLGAAALAQPSKTPPARAPGPAADPAGFKALTTVCGGCHTLALVTNRSRTDSDWRRIYEKMARLGLPGTDDEVLAAGRYIRDQLTIDEPQGPQPAGG